MFSRRVVLCSERDLSPGWKAIVPIPSMLFVYWDFYDTFDTKTTTMKPIRPKLYLDPTQPCPIVVDA